jgi:hypothetical protein
MVHENEKEKQCRNSKASMERGGWFDKKKRERVIHELTVHIYMYKPWKES